MSKEIFFKTVRSDGKSVRATGVLERTYEIGKRYQFDPRLPAHVYRPRTDFETERGLGSDLYVCRPEQSSGNRLLICWGKCEEKLVPVIELWFGQAYLGTTNLNKLLKHAEPEYRHTSDDFEVIGEVFVPPSMRFREIENKGEDCSVIVTGELDPSEEPVCASA